MKLRYKGQTAIRSHQTFSLMAKKAKKKAAPKKKAAKKSAKKKK